MAEHILITGGCGFIGSNLVRWCLKHRPDWRITNLDLLTYCGNPESLADLPDLFNDLDQRYRFVHGDIRDPQTVEPLIHEVTGIIHAAAESHVDRSIMDARPFIETNVLGTQVMLDALRRTDPNSSKRYLQVSTDEVYGDLPLDQPDLRFTETTPIAPNSPYAASKASADHLVLAAHHTFGIHASITRCSNNFGPYQFPEKVIPLFVTNLLEGKKVPLYGDGKNVRDWLHVEDHCEALVAVLEQGKAGEVYNIGGNNEKANHQLTRDILAAVGAGEDMIEHVTDRLGHDRRYAIDSSKIQRELGWQPRHQDWSQALAETVQWYREHESWWRRIKDGSYRAYYEAQYERRQS